MAEYADAGYRVPAPEQQEGAQPMKPNLQRYLVLRDESGTDNLCLSSNEAEAMWVIERVMHEFLTNGYQIACPLANRGMWIARHRDGNYQVEIQLVTVSVN
jgi:hypothetical protein